MANSHKQCFEANLLHPSTAFRSSTPSHSNMLPSSHILGSSSFLFRHILEVSTQPQAQAHPLQRVSTSSLHRS